MVWQKNRSLVHRFRFAAHGIKETFRRERSFRIQTVAFLMMVAFCFVVQPPILWCVIFLSLCGLVLSLELVNTAIESLLDKMHPEFDTEIGFIKDCLASAV